MEGVPDSAWSAKCAMRPNTNSGHDMSTEQINRQQEQSDSVYAAGARPHTVTQDPLVRYLVSWRLKEAAKRLKAFVDTFSAEQMSVLTLCSGEGLEGSILYDLGFTNITVSDISQKGVQAALKRDPRLRGLQLNAQETGLPGDSFDLVVVQDGLHHLPNPVGGFVEMLRVARVAVLFLEPHESLVGRVMGTKWERKGDAVNYVFRWNRTLVEQVASSYMGPGSFVNLSFSFWHHNILMNKLGRLFGGGGRGQRVAAVTKRLLDGLASRSGNQFCGLVVKQKSTQSA